MYSLKINMMFLWTLLSIAFSFFILSLLYENIVVQTFNFGGMTYNPRNDWYVELFFLLSTSLLLRDKVKYTSDLYNWLYFCIILIPSSVLCAEQGSNRFYLSLMFTALILTIFFRKILASLFFRRTISSEMNFKYLPYHSLVIFVVFILVVLAVSVHGVFNLNFQNVYDFRFDISAQMPIFLRYLMPLASATLMGYLVALSVHRKKFAIFFLLFFVGVLFFSFSSHKAMLFYPLVALLGYFLFKMKRPHLLIIWGYSVLAAITLVLPEELNFLGSLFANRIVFVPSHINFYYFDFFSANPFMLWAESKISLGLVDSPLPMASMKYIGGLMTGNYEISANTGWVANGYMNAGVIGIFIYSAVVGLIYVLIDAWANIFGKQLVGAAFLIPVITFIMSADLLITLLTTGLFVLILIFLITSLRIHMRNYLFSSKKQTVVVSNA